MKQSFLTKGLYLLIGWCFVGLGFLGTFLPLVPTTPFLLVALWAFARSSEPFRTWLLTHPLFGPPLRDWLQGGILSHRVKILAVSAMIFSLFCVVACFTVPWYMVGVMALVLSGVALFILSRPSQPLAQPLARPLDEEPMVDETPS